MKKFEFLEHTADAKFIAYGKNLEEAFANAALASFALMTDISKINPIIEKKVEVNSKRKESLLYDFLESLIILIDTEGFMLGIVKELKITSSSKGFSLMATLLGDNADSYEVHTYIKAVTYSDMFIKEEKNLVTVQVVHDI